MTATSLPPAPAVDPTAGCPKRMAYGPCGGVGDDGSCEVPGLACTFVGQPLRRWAGPVAAPGGAGHPMLALMARRPVVVADFPGRALDVEAIKATAGVLAGAVDAGLLGDHGGERVQFPPAFRAQLVKAEGVAPWSGLNCRDRNRVALEGELAALSVVGVAGVHCVTGDHTETGHRPDARPVFDLDGTRLAAAARAAGVLASVGESPGTAPVALRPARLAEKVRAGARVCFVNHAGGAGPVADFVAAAREAGADVPFVACVAVVTDAASAAVVRSFAGLKLPPGYLEGVLAAPDPERAGVAAAVRLGEELLAVPGVVGLNLSGGRPGRERAAARSLATIARQFRAS